MSKTVADRARGAVTSASPLLGFMGAAFMAVGATSRDFRHTESWGLQAVDLIGNQISLWWGSRLLTLGFVMLLVAWLGVAESVRTGRNRAWKFLGLWSLPMLIGPPILSNDAFVYAAAGYVQHAGASVYAAGLSAVGGPYAAAVHPVWRPGGVAYPPLALLVAEGSSLITNFHPYWGVVLQRLPAILGVAVMMTCASRIAAAAHIDPRRAEWWLSSPLIVVHLIGGAHNDAVMLGLVALGMYVAVRAVRPSTTTLITASFVLGVAMLAKPQAGLGVIVVGLWGAVGLAPQVARLAASTCVTVLVFLAGCATYPDGFGWSRWLHLNDIDSTDSITHLILGLSKSLGLTVEATVRAAALSIGAAVVLSALWRFRARPFTAFAWCSLAMVLASPALHPWYLALPWLGFAFAGVSARLERVLLASFNGYLILSLLPVLPMPRLVHQANALLAASALWWLIPRLAPPQQSDHSLARSASPRTDC